MNEDLRALMPSKSLIAGTVLIFAVMIWLLVSPGEKKSSNPFNVNYDQSLNNSGPKLRKVTKVEIVTESTDANGVTHQTTQ